MKSVLNNNNVTIQHSFPSRPQQRHKQRKGASVVTPLVFPTRPPPLTVPPIGPVKFEFFFFHSSESCRRSHLSTDLVGVAGCSRVPSFFLFFLFNLERNWIGCGCVWLGDLRTVQCRVRSIDSPGLVSGSSLLIFFVCSLCRFRLFRSW